ncbi:MAG: LamG domain-containing protein [Planctomycetota bacterium]
MLAPVLALILIPAGVTGAFDRGDPALLGYWSFDEGSGTTAVDLSENGYDGTLNGGVTWTDGKYGGALGFDGSGAHVGTGQSILNNVAGFTLAGWINASSVDVYSSLFGQNDLIEFGFIGGSQVGTWLLGNNWQLVSADYPFEYPSWHHVALTGDAAGVVIYIDGQEAASDTGAVSSGSSGFTFTIGANVFNATGDPFLGQIDDVWVFGRALTLEEIQILMQGSGGYPYALSPNPADGTLHMDTWVTLTWRPGDFAVSHDVYLSDSLEDVDNGTEAAFRGNQSDLLYMAGFPGFAYPDGLVHGTTYYWRIDEVNDADPNSPWRGEIWSFSIPPKTAYNPDPPDGAEFVGADATFSWTPGFGAKLHTVYMGNNFDDVNDAAGGLPSGSTRYNPDALEPEMVYYWRVDETDPPFTHKGDIWSFTTPGAVGNPQPANGTADVQINSALSWTAADNATSHELYIGADADSVGNATTASPEYIGPRALGAESYDPGGLALDSSYAWRVDEVYPAETIKGIVWSFTTAAFIAVDDFESYNDIDPPEAASNRIFDKWIDGFGTTTNGAIVGNDLPPYAEQGIVHGGSQSMPYLYDNNLKTSEATLTLVSPRDWTTEGVTQLSLWFRGDSANAAERMFVALNGTAVVYHDDPSVTQAGKWIEWVIDLQVFANQGVDLTNVDTITIGIGTKNSPAAGGTGTMYFDDIRLYRSTVGN